MAKDFADQLMEELHRYCNGIGEEMLAEANSCVKNARKMLKSMAPRDTGDYFRSWKITKFGNSRRFRFVVYSGNDEYRLTHLLEKGFTHQPDPPGYEVKAQPHIEQSQEWLNKEYESVCERIIKNNS